MGHPVNDWAKHCPCRGELRVVDIGEVEGKACKATGSLKCYGESEEMRERLRCPFIYWLRYYSDNVVLM